jgi:hypothetical protein
MGVYEVPTSSAQLLPDIVASGGVLTYLIGPTPLPGEQTTFSRCLLHHQVQIALIGQGLTLQAASEESYCDAGVDAAGVTPHRSVRSPVGLPG